MKIQQQLPLDPHAIVLYRCGTTVRYDGAITRPENQLWAPNKVGRRFPQGKSRCNVFRCNNMKTFRLAGPYRLCANPSVFFEAKPICKASKTSCNIALQRCKAPLQRCNGALHQCRALLHHCNSPLHRCNALLQRCKTVLHLCNPALHQCNATLHHCSGALHRCKTPVQRCSEPPRASPASRFGAPNGTPASNERWVQAKIFA